MIWALSDDEVLSLLRVKTQVLPFTPAHTGTLA